MRQIVLLVCVVMLSGCNAMTYEEVLAAEKWCTDRGMMPERLKSNELQEGIGVVYCKDAKGSRFRPEVK